MWCGWRRRVGLSRSVGVSAGESTSIHFAVLWRVETDCSVAGAVVAVFQESAGIQIIACALMSDVLRIFSTAAS